ncbi:hypothetical protein [Saccharopolyspora spinosa]|uniref:Uncharacterized protein n=1 Tax=Saccharopolyspora spinosa TaxID=60894 RepID=A0A2N3Y5P5_SACSN|nr:hypothetical protein [Saccharopolyspora spinosa]PKW18244.1 hypothetical protein A8926_6314 [Saccharopolyspora spinosa]
MHLDNNLAGFCEALPKLSQFARQQQVSPVLDDVLRKIREGALVVDQLPRLGIPRDVFEGQRSTDHMIVPGLGSRSAAESYSCPNGRCDRQVRRTPGGPVPECWLLDRPLRRTRG